ncbi:uncharacterized protein LOC110998983 isoform X3 [Pieris rapae]|uniref:uncharacterized protein LOC110998983 isoform X3 n=1 Tax=Pieris rapae TaxID=64459 RepID=UPI001E27AAA6|nr:uncharacterized protein LOC110998983 isoform X3 [Pieris rapae]
MLQPRLLMCGSEMGLINCVRWGVVVLLFTLATCQEINENEPIEASRIKREGVPENRAFNTNAIIYDNTPWRPGRDTGVPHRSEEDVRKLNLATRIMSNGVEVLVRDKNFDGKQEQTKYMDVKTIHATATNNMYLGNLPKLDKRVDSQEDDAMFDLIQPSEVSHSPCSTTSCSCSHTKTESLQSKYTNAKDAVSTTEKHGSKTTKRDKLKLDIKTTNKETLNMKTNYRPYDYEINSQITPTDRIVEKYTEVISDYSDEKETSPLETSDLLTNEQAPTPIKNNKLSYNNNNTSEKVKPEKPQKINKNKQVVAELIKLGSLGIKGLSQLTPIFEKMTGSFMKRQDDNQSTTSTTTPKPATKLTQYSAEKRVDSVETKQGNFPIYIPVDEMETSESQVSFSNVSMHPNFPWALEYKHSKGHILPPKIVQESPLVNGGIPISPGEIIRANSDVIVGKPAVGGPLTLAASGIKLHSSGNRPPLDSFMSDSEQYSVNEPYPLSLPQSKKPTQNNVDDSFDLRPPGPPKITSQRKPSLNVHAHQSLPTNKNYEKPLYSTQGIVTSTKDRINQHKNTQSTTLNNDYGKPAFLDYVPPVVKPSNSIPLKQHIELRPYDDKHIMDSSPSSSEIVSTKIDATDEDSSFSDSSEFADKPFLVDIQPSRVANVLIPHGSSTALIFAGSSEPHKTGEYIDDPLPYPEPGYFGSFNIDAPQMTNVHSVNPSKDQFLKDSRIVASLNNQNIRFNEGTNETRNGIPTRKNNQRYNLQNIPPPISMQETHLRIGPHITVYKPDNYKGDFEKFKQNKNSKPKDERQIIDREYENYLAVPPPPPKQQFSQEKPFIINKPYNQRPIVHTKPIHDMKVFLNVQHPVPDQLPPKITSEVYFASQAPTNSQHSTFTYHIPKTQATNNQFNKPNTENHTQSNSFSIVSSPNISNKSIVTNIGMDNTYSVTLNTGTGVKNIGGNAHMIGSSITVPISTSEHNGEINANIPIGTNFAIRVEDDPSKYDTVALHGKPDPSLSLLNNNKQNTFNKPLNSQSVKSTDILGQDKKDVIVSMPPSQNSHANFPMINEHSHNSVYTKESSSETLEDKKSVDQKRPGKIISNIPTNSHGWYSSILNEDSIKHINNIKVDATTTKVIPLAYDYNKDTKPNINKKITNIGKPPSDFLEDSSTPGNKFNIGRPFAKQKDSDKPTVATFTIKPSYIPTFNAGEQPVYNIPIIDDFNNDKFKIRPIELPKPVYENAEEIYDGKDNSDTEEESDGEVSSESMKVPIVTSSNEEKQHIKSTQDITLTKPLTSQNTIKINNVQSGSQTEKPFGSHNKTAYQSNSMSPIISQSNSYNMKPRPFTVSSRIPLDHQLQQPHWQINQMMENNNNTSYEDSYELNTGEKIYDNTMYRHNTSTKTSAEVQNNKKFDSEVNASHKNSSNIITSTVHISDKKPLFIKEVEKSTLPTYITTSNSILNETFDDNILNLSPPPQNPNYPRPQQNKDLIMGMSPPPPDSSLSKHQSRPHQTQRPSLPIRTPPPYRNIPPRTLPPRFSTPRPVRKPIQKDEVSTYRPSNKQQDVVNKSKRPYYNRYQPSSQLLPPPRELPSRLPDLESIPETPLITASGSGLVFPTASISSSWLTSSAIDFPHRFDFAPTSVLFPEIITSSMVSLPGVNSAETSIEDSYSYEDVSYQSKEDSLDKSVVDKKKTDQSQEETSSPNPMFSNHTGIFNESSHDSNQVDLTDKVNIIPIGVKNRTRKPYPVRADSKYKISSKSNVIAPTRTITRPEILFPTRHVTNKVIRPQFNNSPSIHNVDVIESSETMLEEDFIKPTQVLNEYGNAPDKTFVIEKTLTSTFTINKNDEQINTKTLHHAGNEIKISDEIVPTKTKFQTSVVTFTKTLTELPELISSVGYVNLTHTLTVTHTKTSLISKSEGAVTETLILTNTHTSTVVDVITEIYTHVQPTTIIETVTKHIPIVKVEPTPVQEITTTKLPLDDISMSSEEKDNFVIRDSDDRVTENIQKIEAEEDKDNDTFFIVMNKSQNGGKLPPVKADIETSDYDGITRNEQVNNNGVAQVLFGEILLAGTPYLETTNIGHPAGFGKECQPDCKASRNERCQRIDGLMKCVCRPGFARMFPDRPCKPTYTYSVSLVLASQGNQRLRFHPNLADNSTKEYNQLAIATHEGINRMVMQSDLRDVFHGIHITGFRPIEMKGKNGLYQGVTNDFYVQLSDNAHEYRLKEVIEKYLRNNNYSLGGTDVHAAAEHIDRLNVSDFDECVSGQFHDCSEHAKCFNLRGTYTCSCLEGFADLSVNTLYPGRICSSEAVGCDTCNYHGTCFDRESAVICECFKWYAGRTCQVNLKAVLITVTVSGLLIITAVTIFASRRCCAARSPATQTFVIGCMQGMPSLHQGNMPKQRADRRALIAERETAETCSVQNASLPYVPTKRGRSSKCVMSEPPAHSPPPPPAPAVLIPRARLHQHSDSRDNLSRKKSLEACAEAKLISYLESGATNVTEEMRRKHSLESSYSANKERHNKQGALVSAGFKVSTTVRPEDGLKEDDASSINKTDIDEQLSRFDTLRKSYSQEDNMSEWTDAERRLGELTLSEARSVGGTLPASTGRAASSTRLTHQTSDVSEFDSL